MFGPEVKCYQEKGGELRLVEIELIFFQLGDVLFEDAHQRPQLALHRNTVSHKVNTNPTGLWEMDLPPSSW